MLGFATTAFLFGNALPKFFALSNRENKKEAETLPESTLLTTIEIHINGDAFFYLQCDTWNVKFICDKEHRLRFSQNGEAGTEELGGKKNIVFEADNAEPPISLTGKSFNKILNIADFHPNGLRWKKTEEQTGEYNIVSVFIPNAELYTVAETDKEYGIRKNGEPSTAVISLNRIVAKIVGARIKIRDGGRLKMRVDGRERPISLKTGASHTLSLDNDCDSCEGMDDFLMYYDLVKDAKNPDLKFIAGKVSRNDKTQYPARYQKTAAGKTDKHQYAYILSPEGNCDPVVSDPPPSGGD